MAKKEKLSDEEQIQIWLDSQSKEVLEQINAVRSIIKAASKKLAERIKWNAPSYYYVEDVVTFGPVRAGKVMLVFHHPDIVNIQSDLLTGDYKDRRLCHFDDLADIKKKKNALIKVINEMMILIDQKSR